MITFKNFISNLNFNHILFGFILFSFFYLKNLINKLTNLHRVNLFILNKLCKKINTSIKKNKKNCYKFTKKFYKNYKNIKKLLKKNYKQSNNISNLINFYQSKQQKNIEVIQSNTTPLNNIESVQTNCIIVDEENEFEIIE